MKFADFICDKAVIAQLESRDRDGAIKELVKALHDAGKLGKNGGYEKLAASVIQRENQASTGLGKGVAVPHVKNDGVQNVVAAVGQSSSGIDFSSLDKQPVFTVILLVSPVKTPDQHLQAMENVFKHLQNEKFRKFLRHSQSSEQIVDLFREADEGVYV